MGTWERMRREWEWNQRPKILQRRYNGTKNYLIHTKISIQNNPHTFKFHPKILFKNQPQKLKVQREPEPSVFFLGSIL
jgi:hypothetical protein